MSKFYIVENFQPNIITILLYLPSFMTNSTTFIFQVVQFHIFTLNYENIRMIIVTSYNYPSKKCNSYIIFFVFGHGIQVGPTSSKIIFFSQPYLTNLLVTLDRMFNMTDEAIIMYRL